MFSLSAFTTRSWAFALFLIGSAPACAESTVLSGIFNGDEPSITFLDSPGSCKNQAAYQQTSFQVSEMVVTCSTMHSTIFMDTGRSVSDPVVPGQLQSGFARRELHDSQYQLPIHVYLQSGHNLCPVHATGVSGTKGSLGDLVPWSRISQVLECRSGARVHQRNIQ